MFPEEVRAQLRSVYLGKLASGKISPRMSRIMELAGSMDPDFVGSLHQEGTDVLRTMRNPNRPITSPASSNVPGSTAPFGAEEARNEFWSNPRGVMDQFAVIDVAPEDRPGGGLADLPLEAGSFPSKLANVSETLPIVGPFLDPFVRTENESRAPEDQSQVLNFTKGASEAFPIAAGAAAAGGAVGLGVVGSAALGGGVADVVLGGAPFVDGMTPEQNQKRLASIGISTATGGIGGKVSQYINKWAGNRALEAFKKLAIPGEATEVLTKEASKKTLDPLALASALTGGNVEGIAPHIQAAAKIAGQKSLTDAAKRQLGIQIKDITTSALNKDFAADLVLGAAQAEVTAQATEGRHATGMEFGMGMAQAGAVRGARGIHDANAISKAQGRLVDMQPKVAPEKIAKEILAADPEAKITIDGKSVKADKYPGFKDFSSQEDAARAAFNKVITEGGSEQQAKDAARRAAFDFKKFELTLPVEEQKARQQARDEAKQRAAQAKEDEKRHKVLAAEKEKQEAEAKKQAEIAARATEKAKREADAEAAKAQRAIAKEADRKAKEAQKIADKATKEQEKIAARAAKEAERVAAKAAKAAEKTTAPTEDTPKTSAPADEVVKTGAKTIGFRPTTGVKDDPFAWGKPGYRWVGNVKPHEAEGGAHWKLHLNVGKENYDKVDHWIANNFDGHYKLLSGGESGSKDFTIYVGSKDKASELASRMESEIGDLLGSSDPAVAEGDLPFNGKVAGRFDAVKDKRTTHRFQSGTYGERGIPQSWERQKAMVQAHLARRANDPDSVKVWEDVQANHLKTVDRDLAEAYGEWYTGKQETPVLADPVPDEVTPVETIDVPKVEELTYEAMRDKAIAEAYDPDEVLNQPQPDLKAMGAKRPDSQIAGAKLPPRGLGIKPKLMIEEPPVVETPTPVEEVKAPETPKLSKKQKAADAARGMDLFFQKIKRPEYAEHAKALREIAGDTKESEGLTDEVAKELANEALSSWRNDRVYSKMMEDVPEEVPAAPEGEVDIREQILKEQEAARNEERNKQLDKARALGAKEVARREKAELQRLAEEEAKAKENPGAAKIEDDRVKRLQELRAKKLKAEKKVDPYSFRPLEDPYAGSPYRSRLWSALQKFKPDLKFGSVEEAKKAILGRGDVSKAEIDRAFRALTGVDKPTVRDIQEAFVRDNLVIQEVEGEFDAYGDQVSTPGTTNRRMINFRLPLEPNNFASHYAPTDKEYRVFGNIRASAEAPSLGDADRYPESRTAFHARISDMDIGDGRKALVIEEIQSDAAEEVVKGTGPDFTLSDPASRNRIAIERMISLAIERGYDSIVMAPPAEQSRRNQSLGLDTYKYRGVRRGTDKYYRLVAEWKAAKAEYKGKYEGRHPEKAGDSAYRRAYNAEQELSDYIHSAGPGENPSEVFVDLYGKSRAAVRDLPPELRAKLDALQPGEEYIFTDKEVGYGTFKKVEQNYEKVVFPTFESILKKFGMKPLSKKELTRRFGEDVGENSDNGEPSVGPLLIDEMTGDVFPPDVDSPAFRAAKELYGRMTKERGGSSSLDDPERKALDLEYQVALDDFDAKYGGGSYSEVIGNLAKKSTGETAAKIEQRWGSFDEDMRADFLGRNLIDQHLDAELFPEAHADNARLDKLMNKIIEIDNTYRSNNKGTGPIHSVSLEQKMPYIGGDITSDVKAKFADHRTYLLRPDAGESVPAMKSQDAELNEFKKQVIKAESDAEFSAKGEKGMIAHFNKAVKEGKVSKEIADIIIPVIKKYGKNMSHVSLAFVDGLPGARGIHNSTRDTIMLATEKMTHEGVAAGLEEFFHSMEKILPMEAKIEVRNAYAKEFAAEKKSLEGALAWANANGRREMAKDIAGTLRWLAQAAKGDKPMGMPPIRDYYKFADASEYWASKMMDYEWDRMSGLTHPDDDSLMGRASSWFRNFTNEITDAVEVKFGEDGMKKEWLKLGRLKPRSNPDGSMLKDSVWLEDGSQIRKWADNFSLRPGDGIFGVKQKDLSPEVEEEMMRTTPSSLRPKGFAERYSQAIGAKATSDRKGATKTFLMTKLVDQYYYIKQWEEAVGKWFSAEAGEQKGLHPADSGLARMRTAELATALEEHALTEGQLRFDPEDGTFHAKEGRALKPIWSDAYHAGLEKQFKAYLYAKRTQGAYEQKGVVSKWSANAISEALEYGKLEVAPGKTLESLGSEVHEWMRSFLDIGEAAGIIDPEGRVNWEEASYIPFLLEEGLAKPLEEKGGRGVFTDSAHAPNFENEAYFSQVNSMAGLNEKFTKADPKIFKRDAQKEGMYHQDIFEGLTRMSKHLLSMSAKNSAAKKTLENFADPIYGGDIARRLTTEEFEKKGRGMRYLSVLENGKKVYYEIKDPEMYTMMTNFGADKYKKFSQHPIIKALLVNPSRLFSSFITRSPEFLGVNPLRDSMALWATGSVGDATSARDAMADAIRNAKDNYVDMGKTMIDFFGNEVTAMTKSPELMAMSAAGLAGAGYYGTEPGSMSRNIHREIKMENSPFRVINPVEWYKWMGKVAAVGELRTRRTKYDQVIKAGGTHAEAVQRSLDLINYSMKGNSELLGFFLDTVPFLKARMSGLYKLSRTLSTLPHADRATKQRVLAASVFHRTAMMALASSLMYMYNMTENKDRYESLDENQRDAYWHSWIGDYHIQIPKPFEIGALAGALPERMADLLTGEGTMGDFGDFMMRTLVNNFQLAQLPHTLVPIKEQLENKVGYTERPIVSPALAEMEPEAQYTASTSETARKLAELAPDNAPEWMRSPSRVQHLLDSYFATMGEYAVFATDTMLRAAGQGNNLPAEPTDRLPGLNAVGRIVRKEPADRPRSTKYVASYYDFQRKLDRMNNTIMNYRKLGKYTKADQLEKKFNEDASTYYEGRGLSRYLSALSMQQRMVFEDANMSPQEKRKRIDKLRIESNEAIEKFEKRRRGK